MRIVLVTHFYPAHGGGVEKVALQLAARMVAAGHEVTWCASDTDAAPAVPGLRCEPMPAFNGVERWSGFPWPVWGPRSFARLATLVRGSDAVHVHDAIYASSIVAALLARHHGKPLVVTQHIGEVPLRPLLRPLLAAANRVGAALVLSRARAVAFISPAVRRHFESIVGARPSFHDVANGVDHELFHPTAEAPLAGREDLGFDAARPLLLFVGRFVAKKRLHLVREIAAARPGWQWCIVGQGPERPETWGLANVRVLPSMRQDQLVGLYRAADLLVLPSEGEGFPLVVQEAMACGLPCAISDEVAAGSTMPAGLWLSLPASRERFGAIAVPVIEAWLARPPEQRAAHRRRCVAFATGHWSWDEAARCHMAWLAGASP
jgi:glycosyltransferase involved in cell wall biosynthesis